MTIALIFLSLPPLSSWSFAAEAGKSLYASRCEGCHGADGKGSPVMAKALKTDIPDLTSKEMVKKTDKELLDVFKKGKGKMPPATGLSEKELKDLVGAVRGFGKRK